MSPEGAPDVAGIRARLAKATPGPWENRWRSIANDPNGEQVAVAAAGWQNGTAEGVVVGDLWYDGLNTAVSEPDAEFIAHAPTDIAALLAHTEAQARELAELRGCRECGGLHKVEAIAPSGLCLSCVGRAVLVAARERVEAERDALQAERDALTQALGEAREFVTLANTIWSEDSDGRRAAKLADKRMEELAGRILTTEPT